LRFLSAAFAIIDFGTTTENLLVFPVHTNESEAVLSAQKSWEARTAEKALLSSLCARRTIRYTARRARPARRLFRKTLFPYELLLRLKKPCVFARFLFFGL